MAGLSKKGQYWRITFSDASRTPPKKDLYYQNKEHYPVSGYSKRQIQSLLRDLTHRWHDGTFDPWTGQSPVNAEYLTLRQAIAIYKEKEKRRLAPSTYKNRVIMLNAVLNEYGDLKLHQLQKDFWEQYINEPDKHPSRRDRKTVIAGLYKRLEKEGYDLDVSLRIESSRSQQKQHTVITTDQWITEAQMLHLCNSIYTYAEDQAKDSKHSNPQPMEWIVPIIQLAFYTGMRRSDLFAMKPEWISDDARVVRIGGDYLAKSQLPEELMATIPQARPLLRKLKEQSKPGKPVFDRAADYTSKRFKALVRFALPDQAKHIRFHSLRHSFVMYCFDDLGLRPRVVQQLTRHEDARSLRKYTHYNVMGVLEELDKIG